MLFDDKRWIMPKIPDIGPEIEPWRRLLLDAVEVIQKRGWTSGQIEDGDGGPVCALGALQVARHGRISARARHKGSLNNYSAEDHRMARTKLQNAIGGSIARWNDGSYCFLGHRGAGKAEVIRTFKRIAKS